MTVTQLLSFSTVDIRDVRTGMWQYSLLLAAQFWEAFGPKHPCYNVRKIRIALEGAWKSRIFLWIHRCMYQCFDSSFSKKMLQTGCLLWGGGVKVRADTLLGCTRSQLMMRLLCDVLSLQTRITLQMSPQPNCPMVAHIPPALPSQIYLCNPFPYLSTAQIITTPIIIHH